MVTKCVSEGRGEGAQQHVVYPPVTRSAGTGHISFGIGRGLPDIHREAPSSDL